MLRRIVPDSFLSKFNPPKPEPQEIAFERTYGFDTSFGHIKVTWSRPNFMETSVCTVVRFAKVDSTLASTSSMPPNSTQDTKFQTFSFEVNPTQPDQVRGFKRITVMSHDGRTKPLCIACVAWDFSRASCTIPGSVEPTSCYYFAVVIDREMLVLFGNMPAWVYGLTQFQRGPTGIMALREDSVNLKGTRYNTSVLFRGVKWEISIDLTRGEMATMSIKIDGRKAVDVKSLFKMFRGTLKFELPGGQLIQIVWDLHDWLFGHVYVDLPEPEAEEQPKEDGVITFSFIEQGASTARRICPGNYVPLMRTGRGLTMRKLMEEWISTEEETMYKGEIFCFVVHLWKS